MTNSEWLKDQAGRAGIALRTLADVKAALSRAAEQGSERSLAKLMWKHGRLTVDAMNYVKSYL